MIQAANQYIPQAPPNMFWRRKKANNFINRNGKPMRKATLINSLERAPVDTRLDAIEQLLESIRHDIKNKRTQAYTRKPVFRIRECSLGGEAVCDREEMYRERG